MFALPLLDGDSRITVTTELESKGYVDLTLDMLRRYGTEIENRDYRIHDKREIRNTQGQIIALKAIFRRLHSGS